MDDPLFKPAAKLVSLNVTGKASLSVSINLDAVVAWRLRRPRCSRRQRLRRMRRPGGV